MNIVERLNSCAAEQYKSLQEICVAYDALRNGQLREDRIDSVVRPLFYQLSRKELLLTGLKSGVKLSAWQSLVLIFPWVFTHFYKNLTLILTASTIDVCATRLLFSKLPRDCPVDKITNFLTPFKNTNQKLELLLNPKGLQDLVARNKPEPQPLQLAPNLALSKLDQEKAERESRVQAAAIQAATLLKEQERIRAEKETSLKSELEVTKKEAETIQLKLKTVEAALENNRKELVEYSQKEKNAEAELEQSKDPAAVKMQYNLLWTYRVKLKTTWSKLKALSHNSPPIETPAIKDVQALMDKQLPRFKEREKDLSVNEKKEFQVLCSDWTNFLEKIKEKETQVKGIESTKNTLKQEQTKLLTEQSQLLASLKSKSEQEKKLESDLTALQVSSQKVSIQETPVSQVAPEVLAASVSKTVLDVPLHNKGEVASDSIPGKTRLELREQFNKLLKLLRDKIADGSLYRSVADQDEFYQTMLRPLIRLIAPTLGESPDRWEKELCEIGQLWKSSYDINLRNDPKAEATSAAEKFYSSLLLMWEMNGNELVDKQLLKWRLTKVPSGASPLTILRGLSTLGDLDWKLRFEQLAEVQMLNEYSDENAIMTWLSDKVTERNGRFLSPEMAWVVVSVLKVIHERRTFLQNALGSFYGPLIKYLMGPWALEIFLKSKLSFTSEESDFLKVDPKTWSAHKQHLASKSRKQFDIRRLKFLKNMGSNIISTVFTRHAGTFNYFDRFIKQFCLMQDSASGPKKDKATQDLCRLVFHAAQEYSQEILGSPACVAALQALETL